MIEESDEYQPKEDYDVRVLFTAFKFIIYLGLAITVFSLVFGIIKGLLF